MKINEIIRKKRLEKGYTQEQIASFLGVSPPAVNKWEKASSYPDITLLPALARLLGTDLNTLLSFQEEPTKEEIEHFINELASAAETEGIDHAFRMALDKFHQYPASDSLLLHTALALEGLILTHVGSTKDNPYMDTIEDLYRQVSKSNDKEVGNLAKSMLISKHIGRKEFEAAEKLLKELPDKKDAFDKRQLNANLYLAQEEWAAAAQLIEQKILSEINVVVSSLYTLAEIAFKENQISDAEKLTHIAKQTTGLFDLWECNAHIADFLLAVAKKDTDRSLEALRKLITTLDKEWKPKESVLYRHLSFKDTNKGTGIGQMMRLGIVSELENPENHAYDFLRDHPDIQNLLGKYR
jgi:Predicted transcriptional regulators